MYYALYYAVKSPKCRCPSLREGRKVRHLAPRGAALARAVLCITRTCYASLRVIHNTDRAFGPLVLVSLRRDTSISSALAVTDARRLSPACARSAQRVITSRCARIPASPHLSMRAQASENLSSIFDFLNKVERIDLQFDQ